VQQAGRYTIYWNGKDKKGQDVSSVCKAEELIATKKMLIVC